MQLAVPIAAVVTFGIHLLFAKNAPPPDTLLLLLFWEILAVSIGLAVVATLLGGVAPMDATYVADFYGRNSVTWVLGCDYIRFPLASTAVLSRTRSGITQFDYRPCAFAR